MFSGFRRVPRRGALAFALIITLLFALIAHQHQRSMVESHLVFDRSGHLVQFP